MFYVKNNSLLSGRYLYQLHGCDELIQIKLAAGCRALPVIQFPAYCYSEHFIDCKRESLATTLAEMTVMTAFIIGHAGKQSVSALTRASIMARVPACSHKDACIQII
jgi:hypothetical protein